MTNIIIGRQEEQATLRRLLKRKTADFVAVYGRRRVGKTFLIRNFFKGQSCIYFEATGLKDGSQSPHYLNGISPGFSVAQSLNQLCFQKDGFLFQEFKALFASLFDSSEAHNELIRIISQARQGVSIDRADGIINLCEMKFHQGKFILTKKNAEDIQRKVSLYQKHSRTSKPIYVTLITPEGLQSNDHSDSLVINEITLNNLFS